MVFGIVLFFVLGVAFGYAAGWPWGLVAFIVPLLLFFGAKDKDTATVVVGFIVTAIGVMVGFMLAARENARDDRKRRDAKAAA